MGKSGAHKILLILVALLSACASPAVKTTSELPEHARRLQGGNGDLSITVIALQEASEGWLQYHLKIANKTGKPVTRLRGEIIDVEGKSFSAASDPFEIKKPPSIAEGVLVTTGVATGGMALAMMGIPFIGPLASIGMMVADAHGADSQIDLGTRFARTSLVGRELAGREEISGAFFFPAIKPTSMKIGYVKEGVLEWLVIGAAGESESSLKIPSAPVSTQQEAQDTTKSQAQVVSQNASPPRTMTTLEVQRRLLELGYDPGPADGAMGRRTMAALIAFQKDRGIPPSGVNDDATNLELLKR